MKNKLIILAVLISLGLSGCGNHDATYLPRDTLPGDFMTGTTSASETEPVTDEQTSEAVTTAGETTESDTVTTAPETTADTEAPELEELPGESFPGMFEIEISRDGNTFYYRNTDHPEYGVQSVEFPSDHEYSEFQVTSFSEDNYLVGVDTDRNIFFYILTQAPIGYWWQSPYLESGNSSFYLGEKSWDFSIRVDNNSGYISTDYGRFMKLELKNGPILLQYASQWGDDGSITSITPYDPETLQCLNNGAGYDSYSVNDGVLTLNSEIASFTSDGSAESIKMTQTVWSDDNYKLITENMYYYTLYDKDMNELYDYGYVDANYKPQVASDNGKLTISFKDGGFNDNCLELHYPADDPNVGEVFYQESGFELRHSDDGWFVRMPESNYLVDLKIGTANDPIYGKSVESGDYDIVFAWVDTGESLHVGFNKGTFYKGISEKFTQSFEWNEYKVISDRWNNGFVIDKDGKAVLYTVGAPSVYGKLLECYFRPDGGTYEKTFYRPDLTPLTDTPLISASHLGDGGVIGIIDKHFEIYDADGNFVMKSRDYDSVMATVCNEKVAEYGAFVLVTDGGKLRLVDTDENVVAEYESYDSGWRFHWLLCDYYEKNTESAPSAYYFIFEDSSDVDSDYNTRSVEFWYAPDTGKSGVYESYSSFAYAKPVLYLYPEKKTDITVRFERPERLTTVYPAYNDGWTVTASPDGNLFDGRRNYYALYWEEKSGFIPDFRTGFIVDGGYAEFLEEKLDRIGLSEREANEFIMYWLPILEKNGRSVVWFELTESREAGNRLLISPEPDSLLRVAIHIKKADSETRVTEQKLPGFERRGFAAIEWGGRVYE